MLLLGGFLVCVAKVGIWGWGECRGVVGGYRSGGVMVVGWCCDGVVMVL